MSVRPAGLEGPPEPPSFEDASPPAAAPAVEPAGAEDEPGAGVEEARGGPSPEAAAELAASAERVAASVVEANAPAFAPAAAAPIAGTDVSQVSADEIRRLKQDPATALTGQTIENAQRAYADMIARGARVVVSASAGNGGKPVVTIVPPGFDPAKPARVHTHYHGANATAADPPGHGAGVTARMAEVQARDPQTVFVLPEAGECPPGNDTSPARGYGKDYQPYWENVSSITQTTDDALAAAGVTDVGRRIVSAHSAGGYAIQNALKARPDGSGLRCDQLELEDCLYTNDRGYDVAASVAAWAKTDAGRAVGRVFYYHGTNIGGRDAQFSGLFGNRYAGTVKMAEQGPDPAPILKGPDGRPLPGNWRQWSRDAHNRTVGQFMDAGDP